MAKRKEPDDDEPRQTCTNLDHIYPDDARKGTPCYCGKKRWGDIPDFIKFDDRLRRGDMFRIVPHGPIFRVESVIGDSRARCVPIGTRAIQSGSGTEEEVVSFEAPGRSINISVTSCVIRVTPQTLALEAEQEEQEQEETEPAEEDTMATAAVELPVSTTKQNRERIAALKAKKANGKAGKPLSGAAAAAKSAAARKPKEPKTVRECACGCGEETQGYFYPGHDARYKSWMVKIERGQMDPKQLPKEVQKANTFKKTKAGFVTTHNYKGEPHKGYDK